MKYLKNLTEKKLIIFYKYYLLILNYTCIYTYIHLNNLISMGIGDWGLGIGDWAQSPIPNPQTPIPNPQR